MKMKIKKHLDKIFIASLALAIPLSAFAQSTTCLGEFKKSGTIGGLFDYIFCLINSSVIPLLFAIALVVFIWGVVQFISGAENEEKREKGRQFMLWGILGLAVMVSVWGLVAIFNKSFGFDNKTNSLPKSSLPQLPTR